MFNKIFSQSRQVATGIAVTVDELIALRSRVIHTSTQSNKEAQALFSGQSVKMRGRGIEFDGTHEYQPGEDIRHMAWRITARSLKPHVKVYHEEKERPVWLAIDLSPSLYFGTRCMFKSVSIIKQAAFLGWSHLQLRERVGAIIANSFGLSSYSPKAKDSAFLAILKTLADFSTQPAPFTQKTCLDNLLIQLQQQARSGNFLVILSDFLQFEQNHKKIIASLAQRAQVKLIFVYDPFEIEAPPVNQYMLTDGQQIVTFHMDKLQQRKQYRQQFQDKITDLVQFSRKYNITLQGLCTDPSQNMVLK